MKEVHGMNDLIKLKLVTEDEAECLHRLQVEAFMPLYEKYQDDDTSPARSRCVSQKKNIFICI